MNEQTTISVFDALYDFGFTPDSEVISDIIPGLSFDFGDFKLSASALLGKWYNEAVLFTGVLATPRTLTEVCFELPRKVDSREQLAAFLAYYLDNSCGRERFYPEHSADWLAEGRSHRLLLPWEVDRAVYNARPHCFVPRKWMRLALNCLEEILAEADDMTAVEFSFDGKVLMIHCSGQVLPVSAEGSPWTSDFTIPTQRLRNLPKRLMREKVEVSVYEGRLQIGSVGFNGVVEKNS